MTPTKQRVEMRTKEVLDDSLNLFYRNLLLQTKCHLYVCSPTLVVENFFSKMRSRNDMPTVPEFAHLFVPTIRESLKQLTDTGLAYHTLFRELPTIPLMPSVPMAKEEQKLTRDVRDS